MIIICGPGAGKTKKYACICCHWESDNEEDFAVSMCWECGLSADGKPGCESCAEMREAEEYNDLQRMQGSGSRPVQRRNMVRLPAQDGSEPSTE